MRAQVGIQGSGGVGGGSEGKSTQQMGVAQRGLRAVKPYRVARIEMPPGGPSVLIPDEPGAVDLLVIVRRTDDAEADRALARRELVAHGLLPE